MLLHNSLIKAPAQALLHAKNLLINSFDVSDRIYVETTGSDTTGDGSKGNPYATRSHAVAQAQANNKKAIIYGSGIFSASNQNQGSLNEAMCGTDYDGITHIGTPNGTIFTEGSDNGQRDNTIIGTGDADTVFAFIHFKRDNNSRTDSYKVSVLCNQYNLPAKGKAFNCIFEELNANGGLSLSYNNNGTSIFELSNCLFIADTWLAPTGSAETGITVKNCAATGSADYGTTSTVSNNANNVTVDVDSRISNPYIDFDGADDYIEYPANSGFAFGTGDFSIYGRLVFDALSERYLFGPGGRGNTSGYEYGWGVRYSPARGLCFFRPAGADDSTESYCSWSPVIGQEYAILIVRENGTIKMYIDGVEQSVANSTRAEDIGDTLNFRIGHSANTNGSYKFDGKVYEVHVVTSVALSASYFPENSNSPKHVNTVLLVQATPQDKSTSEHTSTLSGDVTLFGDNYNGVYSGWYSWAGIDTEYEVVAVDGKPGVLDYSQLPEIENGEFTSGNRHGVNMTTHGDVSSPNGGYQMPESHFNGVYSGSFYWSSSYNQINRYWQIEFDRPVAVTGIKLKSNGTSGDMKDWICYGIDDDGVEHIVEPSKRYYFADAWQTVNDNAEAYKKFKWVSQQSTISSTYMYEIELKYRDLLG